MTIFLGGMHGTGKTFLAERACTSLDIHHATASQLIRTELGRATWNLSKEVDEIDQNQAALVSATQRLLTSGKPLLLDGHFVLRGTSRNPELISSAVFRDLRCRGALLLTCPADVILARLKARGDESWSEESVQAFSQAELTQAKLISKTLGFPLIQLNTPSVEDFLIGLQAILRDG